MVAVRHSIVGAAMVLTILAATPIAASSSHLGVHVDLNSVVIDKAGVLTRRLSGDETAATCSRFRLSAADARAFFAAAKPVGAEIHGHLDGSNCVTMGRARMHGGTPGNWVIDLERRGELILADGHRRYYYCAKCRSSRYDDVDPDAEALVGR